MGNGERNPPKTLRYHLSRYAQLFMAPSIVWIFEVPAAPGGHPPLLVFFCQISCGLSRSRDNEAMVKDPNEILSTGKLPSPLLGELLAEIPQPDKRVIVGPGVGIDCAVLEFGDRCLVIKSDPITFATDQIGRYAVHVNANDIATTGANPKWFVSTILLPEGKATFDWVREINRQICDAAEDLGITVIGGHTEITHGLNRPVLSGTMIGEVERERLVTPDGIQVGDEILLTKGIPIEATAILAKELGSRLNTSLNANELEQAARFLHDPGISVVADARLAISAGRVSAMHDPTEGGLIGALWELAEAGRCGLCLDRDSVPIFDLSVRICRALEVDPLAAIASGALLVTAPATDSELIRRAFRQSQITCEKIGQVEEGPASVFERTGGRRRIIDPPDRDEIARLFDE